MFKCQRILVPLNGFELAERAIAPAINLAKAMAAEVIFLTVVEPLTPKTVWIIFVASLLWQAVGIAALMAYLLDQAVRLLMRRTRVRHYAWQT
jgi:nucleotide-binding universal stress UspA family protein